MSGLEQIVANVQADLHNRIVAEITTRPWRDEFGALFCPCSRRLTDARGGVAPCPRCDEEVA